MTRAPGATTDWSVVVVSFNTGPLLGRCLRSVLDASRDRAVEVVVVDNASDDGTLAELPEDERVRAIANDRNVGFPQAVNQGLAAATGTRVVVLNPDTEVPVALFEALDAGLDHFDLVTCAQQGDDGVVAATGPDLTLREIVGQVALRRRGAAVLGAETSLGIHRFRPVTAGYLSGYCLAAEADTFRELGGLDPKLFWAEDVDVSLRALRTGRTLGVCTSVQIEHERTYSVQRFRGLVTFFQLTGKVGFARRHRPGAMVPAAVVIGLVALLRCTWFATLGSGAPDARSRVAAYGAVLTHLLRRQWRLPDGWDPAVVDRLSAAADANGPMPAPRTTGGEWVLGIAAVVVLARSSVLFVRQRFADRFGGPIGATWQDDPLVSSTFLFVELLALVVVVRKDDLRELRHHLVLSVLVVYAFASMEWSIEPGTTQLRAFGLAGTCAVGWFLATRFSLRQQLDVVIAAGSIGIVASVAAAVVLPDQARFTNGDAGQWSGVFINRNLLALVLCVTFLAMALRWWSAAWNHRAVLVGVALLGAYLLLRSGGRTAPVALFAALGVVGIVAAVRHVLGPRIGTGLRGVLTGGVTAAVLVGAGTAACLALRYRIFELLDREPTLHRRDEMWSIAQFYIDQRPWRGFGLEAIWTHPPIVDGVFEQYESYPYQAHQGYLEMQLSLGRIGLALLVVLIGVTVLRTFRLAWTAGTAAALWPIGITAFVVVTNFSESLFVSNEIQLALFVAAGIAAAGAPARRELEAGAPSSAPVGAASPGSR